jgi:hypothetical protein
MTAVPMNTHLPTGGCKFDLNPHVPKITVCGCQRFFLRPRTHKKARRGVIGGETVTLGRARRGEDGGEHAEEEDEDDVEEWCRCGHHACFHDGHPPIPPRPHALELQQSRCFPEPGNVTTACSVISGMTTERDSSTRGTPIRTRAPLDLHHPRTTTRSPPRSTKVHTTASRPHGEASRQLQDLVSHRLDDRPRSSPPPPSERLPSMPPSFSSATDRTQARLKQLVRFVHNLKNEHMTTQERLEMVEALPANLGELAEKVDLEELAEKVDRVDDHVHDLANKIDLMDETVNEQVDSCETRLMTELDDRLAPIESFVRAREAQGEKRKHRQLKDPSEGGDTPVEDKKRRKQRHDHGTTNFTTTSFTTTSFTTSFSSQLAQPVDERRFLSEIENLKEQLRELEAIAPPSVTRPWVIEVVLIPAAPLKGVWADAPASIPSTQHTGSEVASAYASLPGLGRNSSSSQLSGMAPLAFPQNSKVYKRLHSRGFIKTLHISGPTARDVSVSIETNFDDIFEFCSSSNPSSLSSSQRTANRGRGGTLNLWEPLRKVYKRTILEYLSPSELSLPAIWTVEFLKANCIMRGTNRRALYILPRTRGHFAMSNMTWDNIKQLKRFYEPPDNQQAVVELDAEEPFWDFDPKLDAKPLFRGFSRSFASFGPFSSDSGGKLSFSSHPANPQLQLHREVTQPSTPPVENNDTEVPTDEDDDSARDLQSSHHRRERSSVPLPPSPPQTYPPLTQENKVSAQGTQGQRKSADDTTPIVEAAPETRQRQERSQKAINDAPTPGLGAVRKPPPTSPSPTTMQELNKSFSSFGPFAEDSGEKPSFSFLQLQKEATQASAAPADDDRTEIAADDDSARDAPSSHHRRKSSSAPPLPPSPPQTNPPGTQCRQKAATAPEMRQPSPTGGGGKEMADRGEA